MINWEQLVRSEIAIAKNGLTPIACVSIERNFGSDGKKAFLKTIRESHSDVASFKSCLELLNEATAAAMKHWKRPQ